MKLSKGTTFEFTISILLISLCLIDIKNYWFTVPFGIASILTIIDCLIKWFKIRKDNNNKIINTFKPKKIYYVILIVSLILNIVFTSSISFLLVNENNQKKKIKEYKKCAQKIEYKTNSTISTILDPKTGKLVPKIDDIYYFLNEKEWKQLKECSKKYNIKIKTN